jgi:nitroimidazol reductase NimA-like FMN-containing flavoprotein (pyridoxamine 5'-phosphate oxidase superfamily)
MTGSHTSTYVAERLDDAGCERLLRQASLGRVILSVGCLPAAVPVHVNVAKGHVLLGCPPGPVLDAATRGDVVSIEVDGEELDGATWSVLVTGVARVVTQGDPLSDVMRRDRLARSIERGAVLVAVPLTYVAGERTAWTAAL